MLERLKRDVCEANLMLPKHGLVTFTWGNVSGFDPKSGYVVIKPSGVPYDALKPADMVVVDLNGYLIEGALRPSSDTPTHIALYRAFPKLGGIVHTHSRWATTWAQAGRPISVYGTTHADYFYTAIPCTRKLTPDEISERYEENTGNVIIETIGKADPMQTPAVLCHSHGPFAWGNSPLDAVEHAVVLEEIAQTAFYTEALGRTTPVSSLLIDRHYFRKHGEGAYYGQQM